MPQILGNILKLAKHSLCSRSIAVALAALAALFAGLSGDGREAKAQFSESKLKTTVGAWQVRCGRPPGAKAEKCALVQSVKAEDRENVSLTIIFLRSYRGDKKLLRVVAPLGVLLPTGLGLKIDGADVGNAPFLKCGRIGCVAEIVVDDQLLEKIRAGQNAIFIIFQTPEEGIGVPIELTGFSDGLSELN